MLRRTLLPSLLLLLLSGCAVRNIAADHALGSRGTGVVAGSITYAGGYAKYTVALESMVTGEVHPIEHGASTTWNPVLAFKGAAPHPGIGVTGAPFAVALPEGRYRLAWWRVEQGSASAYKSVQPLGLEFDVARGETVYLGNFHFRIHGRVLAWQTASLTLEDRFVRDEPVLVTEFPALQSASITPIIERGTRIANFGGQVAARTTLYMPIVVK